MSYFPKDIINLILEYDGRIKYKNGKYFNVINIKDKKYESVIDNINSKKNRILSMQYSHTSGCILFTYFNWK